MENLQMRNFRIVGAPVIKKDAKALVTGKPVFTDDLALKDCLVVKVLRSPYAHALITEIDCAVAVKIPGIECIITHKDVPRKRFTMAGQTYPEPSPYDRLILDERLRFVGDAVAVVAGETEAAVDHAMRLIRVKYQVLEPVLDMHDSKDGDILVHPEDSWESHCDVGADNRRNLCASGKETHGDLEEAFAGCTHVIERVYHTKANQQAMMETFRAYTYMDVYGRLNIVASTQVPFHTRRILAHALDVPKSRIRVIKPRIGGGFGAKQTVVAEVYPAIVTMKTGKPAKIIYSRYESQIASSPRHEMEVRVKLGCDDRGVLQAMDVYTLSNTGAYGEHGPTTVGLSGHKSIPLYRTPKAFRFAYDVVYTNRMSAGAYRGYGATQGIFAVESAVSELAAQMGMDPVAMRELNMVKEGDIMPAYYGE
ncbi:xanthine dehydrogenase family protein molybdopterin-binding subunit, partial [Enterocloster citroniae]